jgi:negative regulator of flagellin synthesis FlgM
MEITPKDSVNIEAYVNQVQDKDKVDATSEQPEKQQTEAQNQLEAIPDVREDKVAQLKEQIENGTYDMDEEKIAHKMISDALLNDLV